jgi:mRNA interferase RelE/StbE
MVSKPAKVLSKAPAGSLRAHRYRLRFEAQAWAEWKKLDGAPKAALREVLIKRLDQPHIPAAALKGELAGCYKIKLLKAGYRLVYEVLDDVVVVLVLAVGKREDSAAYSEAAERMTNGAREAAAKALRLVKPKSTQAKKSTKRAM